MAENVRPPVAIRIVRPYDTEDDFLSNELETVGKTSVILIGAHPRPNGVILRFEVTLANGATVLRGEGRVLAHKENAFRGQPGLALRFTRLDPKSKALVDRAASLRDSRLSGEMPIPSQAQFAAAQAVEPEEPPPLRRSSHRPNAHPAAAEREREREREREGSLAPDPVLAEALTSATPPPPPFATTRRSAPPPGPEAAEAATAADAPFSDEARDEVPREDVPHDEVIEVRTSEPELLQAAPVQEHDQAIEDAIEAPPAPRARAVYQLDPPTPPPPAVILADPLETTAPEVEETPASSPSSSNGRAGDRDALLARLRERAARLPSERVDAILGRR